MKKVFYMSKNSIDVYLEAEAARGIVSHAVRVKRRHLMELYGSLPPNKAVTRDRLMAWRQTLDAKGYANQTIANYIKTVNGYLAFFEREDLKPVIERYDDLKGQQFGNLEVLELTDKRKHKYRVWKCRCSCGKEKEFTSGELVSGNTTSCGCKIVEKLMESNQYIEGTSLRQSLEEKVESTRSRSGYTGVILKRNKWVAYITYKKKRYFLGSYDTIEEAVKARSEAKALVIEDAEKLIEKYNAKKAK